MVRKANLARILKIPEDHSMAGGRLDSVWEDSSDIIIDYQELRLTEPPKLLEQDGRPTDQSSGVFVPRRIRFEYAFPIRRKGLFIDSSGVPENDPGRGITSALHWYTPDGDPYHLLDMRAETRSTFQFIADHFRVEKRSGDEQSVTLVRDWSPVPDSPER